MTNLINKSQVRLLLLDLSARTRAGKFKRVSASTYETINRRVNEACESIVRSHPSKGKTIKV